MAAQYLLISMAGLPAALGGRAFVALNTAVSRPKVTMYVSLCDGDFKSTAKRRFYVRLVWFLGVGWSRWGALLHDSDVAVFLCLHLCLEKRLFL